jgi:competence protein ComEC
VPPALAAIVGITLDAQHHPSITVSASLLALGVLLAMVGVRRCRLTPAVHRHAFGRLLLRAGIPLGIVGGFAALHERQTRFVPASDISRLLGEGGRIVRVRGHVAGPVTVRLVPIPFSRGQTEERTSFEFLVHGLGEGERRRAVAGRLLVSMPGRLEVERGAELEFAGTLRPIEGPMNEGEFDRRAYLAERGIRGRITGAGATDVTIMSLGTWWSPLRLVDRLRSRIGAAISELTPPEEAGLTEALIAGNRQAITREELAPFFETGTLHLLVVSGMHVVLFWQGLRPILSLLGLSVRAWAWVSWVVFPAYALLTGGDPPVVRATIAICLATGSYLTGRPAPAANGVAAAVLVVLAMDPAALFRAGPQLSFVAVLLIQGALPKRLLADAMFDDEFNAEPDRAESAGGRLGRALLESFQASVIITILLAPLTLSRFSLLTPLAMLIGPLLVPLVTVALISGSVAVAVHALAPALGWIVALPCVVAMRMLRSAVAGVEDIPWGFLYAPPPPDWWTVGFHVLLLVPPLVRPGWRLDARALAPCGLWIVVGAMALIARPTGPAALELHQLAVGHGGCTVIRFPDGRTALYDCGSLTLPQVGERVIAPWLWRKGIGRIDLIIISHADLDHFRGLPALARRFAVGRLACHPSFLRSEEPAAIRARQELLDQPGGPPVLTITVAGDRFRFGDHELVVLQPGLADRFESDNAGSLLVALREVTSAAEDAPALALLTGDLSGSGLSRFLRSGVTRSRVLLSPHHGSRSSNTPALAEAVRPEVVIAGDGQPRWREDPLKPFVAVGARVFHTFERGTVRCRFLADRVEVTTFRPERNRVDPLAPVESPD